MELFNEGDFAGVAQLYTEDATALPPGGAMAKGRAAIEAMWKGAAEQISDLKITALDVKTIGPNAAREIGTFSLKAKGATRGGRRQVRRGVGEGRQRLEACNRYLERWQVARRLREREDRKCISRISLHSIRATRSGMSLDDHRTASGSLAQLAPFVLPGAGIEHLLLDSQAGRWVA